MGEEKERRDGATFDGHVFPKFSERAILRSQMNGFDDPDLKHFVPLAFSPVMKEEYKEDRFELEFVRSFANAALVLARAGRAETDGPGYYAFLDHSYPIPVLYMTRHCMELEIKRTIRRLGGSVGQIHKLDSLWSSLLSRLPKRDRSEDRRAVKNMGEFVHSISKVDETGFNLRYPKDKKGNFTQGAPLFVDDEEVAGLLLKFIDQLESIGVPADD